MNAALFHKLMAIREKRIIPTDGLELYKPLNTTTYQGVPCVNLTSKRSIAIGRNDSLFTLSFWCNPDSTERYMYALYGGSINVNTAVMNNGRLRSHNYSPTLNLEIPDATGHWHFVLHMHDTVNKRLLLQIDDTIKTADGEFGQASLSSTSSLSISNDDKFFSGYFAGLRLYSRALSDNERMALRHEFTPTED